MTRIDIDGPVTIVPLYEPVPEQPPDDTLWWLLLAVGIVVAALVVGH